MEVYPKVPIDEGEIRRQVIFGGQRATSFIKDVVAGKSIDGRKYKFNDELVMAIHSRVSAAPGVETFLRQTDSTTIGGEPVMGSYEQLPFKMHLFGRWLEEQVDSLRKNPEDLISALYTAAAAHYGIVYPEFHPFDNGNGRTARALMNAILMSQSYELSAHGLAIPPIPIIRTRKDEGHYIRSLRAVDQTRTLNPFMSFIANKWIESLTERLTKIHAIMRKPKTKADQLLMEKLERRRQILQQFIKSEKEIYQIPDYFVTRYVRVTHA